MKRSLVEQRRKSLKLHILKLTRNIDELKHQLVVDKEASNKLAADQSRLPSVEEEMETLQSVKCARSDIEYHASPEGHLEEENAYNNGPMESMVESASKNLDVLISPAADNVSNKMASTAKFLSNKERLLLRKQALNMKKRPVLAVGRSNIVTGVAKTINTHFKKHPLAIVNVKGRAKGTSVQEVVLKLQEATGAVLVSQEPSKVILYRGWGANDEPARGDKRNVKDSPVQNRPAVSPELIAAIKFECGLQCHQEEEAP
ncbi:hypothetical protein V6Z12_A09G030300 [Gossypium hirsutum]